ncbi:chaperone NapD [Curvibacter sp. APW13]|uniref:chaperone NapD n=1 Tax=Curvibacter sp. APW13 TaxID=3077236 RepID=UPI0028E09292|nr:chaperone NapD [Curvibacter sp. APW13]MDT8990771.1 chaperone NapD [Curvibacter sp. APW13]
MNISSAIVYAQPGREPAVRARLSSMPGVEIHAASEDGKIVITLESESDRSATDQYEAIGREEGVLNIAMVYQQTESHPDQEI